MSPHLRNVCGRISETAQKYWGITIQFMHKVFDELRLDNKGVYFEELVNKFADDIDRLRCRQSVL
jgi:hypothetical protein